MTLLWILGQATVVLALIALADALLRRRLSAASRHWIWTLALVSLLILPVLSRALPPLGVTVGTSSAVPAATVPGGPAPAASNTFVEGITNTGTPPLAANAAPNGGLASMFSSVSLAATLWTMYLSGVGVLLGRIVLARRAARASIAAGDPIDDPRWRVLLAESARAIGCSQRVTLVRSDDCAMPMAVGIRTPTIVIPSFADAWSDDRRQAVLLHELAHIARRDCLTQTAASVATALYWPNPAIWWAAARLRVERELACDDRVLAAGSPARAYATHLLEIAHALGRRAVPAHGVTMARPHQLEGRLLAVIDTQRNRRTLTRVQQLLVVATIIGVVLPVAALRAVPAPPARVGLTSFVADTAARAVPQERPVAPRRPAQATSHMSGTWELRPSSDNTGIASVHLRMTDGDSSNGHSFPLSALEGIRADTLTSSASSNVRFTLKRDAGTFTFEGVCANRACGGAYTFAADPAFAAELTRRGIAKPTETQQYEMARDDVRLALVDELKSQGYATPSIDDLVRAGQHGVTFEYVRDFGALGYKVGQIDRLVNMRDHGVTSDYVKALQGAGYRSLTVDQLVEARDHGVTPEFTRGIHGFGYNNVTLDELIVTRDHGVDPSYIKNMTDIGYGKLSLQMYIRMRDHGVTPEWARKITASGHLDADELIQRRDRGGS